VKTRTAARAFCSALVLAACGTGLLAQAGLAELKAEHDPGRRSEKALVFADQAFENAKEMYSKGQVHKGDEDLDQMTAALKECMDSLDEAHKAKFYKKAELRVAFLQRRMQGLLDDLSIQERGWAEYTNRKLDELHEKMLEGVMRK
jgi:polyhydroxyalkanoate synthesis regulator phasin